MVKQSLLIVKRNVLHIWKYVKRFKILIPKVNQLIRMLYIQINTIIITLPVVVAVAIIIIIIAVVVVVIVVVLILIIEVVISTIVIIITVEGSSRWC